MGKEKTALITGITGQDGAYLAELLLEKGYTVHGIKRRASRFNTDRIDHLYQDPHVENQRLILHYGDMTDSLNLTRIIQESRPDEIYNLAAQSHVQVSFDTPEYTANVDALGVLRILEAVRLLGFTEKTRIYQASTSELYGKAQETPQSETTPFYPRSPYAAAKLYGYWIVVNYREAYDMFACNGILFNHESPLRGETFVTRKITRAAARIVLGLQEKFYIGNLEAKRDWGHARDYVEAMWLMLQQDKAEDFVIATGTTAKVRDIIEMVFAEMGIGLRFEGKGEHEKGFIDSIDADTFEKVTCQPPDRATIDKKEAILEIDLRYFRPTEVDLLVGDASRARQKLGWEPKHDLQKLLKEMVASDLKLFRKDLDLMKAGHKVVKQAE